MRSAAAILLVLVPGSVALADSTPIQVNPNRPTFSTPALTTQDGVAELEFGVAHSALDPDDLDSSPFLLKFGLRKRLELRIGGNGLLHATGDGMKPRTGYGDTTLGAQWTFWPNGPLGIDEAVQVTWKLPTASSSKGLGSGETDVLLMFLLSRDVGAFHIDLNVLANWLGRKTPRFDGGQPAASISVSRVLQGPWTLTGELYSIGGTSGGKAIVSNLWAIGYKVSPRFVLDAGVDAGLTETAPNFTLFAGLTVGLAHFRH